METQHNAVKILVVGEAASIHTAKYVSMLQKIGYNVRLFSNSQNSYQDELLKNVAIYYPNSVSYMPVQGNIIILPFMGFMLPIQAVSSHNLTRLIKGFSRIAAKISTAEKKLLQAVKQFQPDVVISLKMQNDGYVTSNAKIIRGNKFPPWVHFIWGTDIEFFGLHPDYKSEHLPKIKALLGNTDYLLADTLRDLEAAKQLGFAGQIIGKQVAQGGFDVDTVAAEYNQKPFEQRKIILVKGRNGGLVGRAMVILEALYQLADKLADFQVKIIMPTPDIIARAAEYTKITGLNFECITKRASYTELMEMFSNSRIAISATDVDGTPGFLLETMVTGALPVHSDMQSIREWVEHGQNGLLFNVEDVEQLKAQILQGLQDAQLFDRARTINTKLMYEQADEKVIAENTKNMITTILARVTP